MGIKLNKFKYVREVNTSSRHLEIPLIIPLSEDRQKWSVLLLLDFLQLLIIFSSNFFVFSFSLFFEQTLLSRFISSLVFLIVVFHFSSWKLAHLWYSLFFTLPISYFIGSFSPVYKQAQVGLLSFHALILSFSFILWSEPVQPTLFALPSSVSLH